MRHCLLLPIKGQHKEDLAFEVFEFIESYLKTTSWCRYRPNSEILNILHRHQESSDSVLESKKVLKTIAQKSNAGSLIKINMNIHDKSQDQVGKGELKIKIFGANGEDLFFNREKQLKSLNPILIGKNITHWLNEYQRGIPYDGRIIEILGNQFIIDFGKTKGLISQIPIEISRLKKKKKHPLFKQIIGWEKEELAEGVIVHSNKKQTLGSVRKYYNSKHIKIGDWVTLKKNFSRFFSPPWNKKYRQGQDQKTNQDKELKTKFNPYRFGKLGTLKSFLNLGKASATSENREFKTKKIGGILLGIDFSALVWATRNYWGEAGIKKNFSWMQREKGIVENRTNSGDLTRLNLKFGYKYLPIGFFNGPQLNAFFGYSRYSFGIDSSQNDRFTGVKYSGILWGGSGSIPIDKLFRLNFELSFIFGPEYEEDFELYPEPDSTSLYNINFGLSYSYLPNMTLHLNYEITSAKAIFKSPDQSFKVKESQFKFGTSFNF